MHSSDDHLAKPHNVLEMQEPYWQDPRFSPPELEQEPLDNPANLIPFPVSAKPSTPPPDVDLPW
ncbi:hypothetical protein OJ996_11180 [Luteolibacter sp. GHJ8]|uniref:Uncharacterized protein n=1 Tax=Luteolibacter rhizosphaerae TaxID=2989719 RepID=A0ABT3G2S1_9BACT|nr:hypothetical protein [Luteolibacter rhizosphaerae]MCW1914142.1 hypothetical protein [Luteolibacter rhizosphaerae]